MHPLRQQWSAAFAFAIRNFQLVRHYLGWEIVFWVYAVVGTLTIGLIGVSLGDRQQTLYLLIGALLWNFLSSLFHEVSHSVAWERWEGTIEYTFMAPVHRLAFLGGNCLFGVVYSAARTLLIFAAALLFFDLDLSGANLPAALAVLALSSASFLGLGLLAAVLPLLSQERGPQAVNIMQGVLLLLSGVYYPVSVLPGWLQPLAWLSPATYTLEAMRAALLQGAALSALTHHLWPLALAGLVLIPAGIWGFARAEAYALRNGVLKRSG